MVDGQVSHLSERKVKMGTSSFSLKCSGMTWPQVHSKRDGDDHLCHTSFLQSMLGGVEGQLSRSQKGYRDSHFSHISKEERCLDDHSACLSQGGRVCHSLCKGERMAIYPDLLKGCRVSLSASTQLLYIPSKGEWMAT